MGVKLFNKFTTMDLHINGKVFNLPLDVKIYYDKELNCVYVLFEEIEMWRKFEENMLKTLLIKHINELGLHSTNLGFYRDGTTLPSNVFIQ